MELFSFQNNPKNLDPSYKTDLDIWDCLGRVKPVLQQHFIGLIKIFVVILERGKTPSYSQINTELGSKTWMLEFPITMYYSMLTKLHYLRTKFYNYLKFYSKAIFSDFLQFVSSNNYQILKLILFA